MIEEENKLIHSYDSEAQNLLVGIFVFLDSIKNDKAKKVQAGGLIISMVNLVCKTPEEKVEFFMMNSEACALANSRNSANREKQTVKE